MIGRIWHKGIMGITNCVFPKVCVYVGKGNVLTLLETYKDFLSILGMF